MFEAMAIFIIGFGIILQMGSCTRMIKRSIDDNTKELRKENARRN